MGTTMSWCKVVLDPWPTTTRASPLVRDCTVRVTLLQFCLSLRARVGAQRQRGGAGWGRTLGKAREARYKWYIRLGSRTGRSPEIAGNYFFTTSRAPKPTKPNVKYISLYSDARPYYRTY